MGKDKRIRTFIAFELSAKSKEILFSTYADLTKNIGLKWVPQENLHSTLLFLGSITRDQIEQVKGILNQIEIQTCQSEIEINTISGFPSPPHMRILWLGPESTPEWSKNMYSQLRHCLKKKKIQFDAKPEFIFHITIARIKKYISPTEITTIINNVKNKLPFKISLTGITLFESQLSTPHPVYSPISRREIP